MKKISTSLFILVFALILATVSACSDLGDSESAPASSDQITGVVVPGTPGPLPVNAARPQPQSSVFQGCPPEGDGGDPDLNRLKNREDEGNYIPIEFDSILTLPWPPDIERRDRANWSADDAAFVAQYEGLPVAVEGYIARVRETGPGSGNCHGEEHEFLDWHVWLVNAPTEDRSASIIAEPTPRIRARHPAWTLDVVQEIDKEKLPVRISGWLFLDPEHPDQVGQTRGTIWEIHPIMQIEVQVAGRWVTPDRWAGSP